MNITWNYVVGISNLYLGDATFHTSSYMVGKCVCHAIEVGDYHIPKGTTILVSLYLLHQDLAF